MNAVSNTKSGMTGKLIVGLAFFLAGAVLATAWFARVKSATRPLNR